MAMSAFNKAGARLVERFDTSVTELELRYANNRLIGQEGGDENVRRIYAGQMPGSDYYFVGGITELNYNIRSMGVDAQGGHTDARDGVGNIGGRLYVMNIALDFRLIDTRTLEVVDVISYQKQIIGRELRAGVFSFFDDTLIDIAAGERALEPVQLAVRAGVERSVVEVMSRMYNVSDSSVCSTRTQCRRRPDGPGAIRHDPAQPSDGRRRAIASKHRCVERSPRRQHRHRPARPLVSVRNRSSHTMRAALLASVALIAAPHGARADEQSIPGRQRHRDDDGECRRR